LRLHHLLMFFALATPAFAAPLTVPTALSERVVKLRAIDGDGTISFGSAVVVDVDRLATTCHVTRHAKTIEVYHGAQRWIADTQVGSVHHDICVLTVHHLNLPVVPKRPSVELKLQERVVAVGFPRGGELATNEGVVEALYGFDEAQVIRTSANFDFGASGGGLFDQAGNLIGFLAFKTRTGEALRFALPVDWILPQAGVASSFGAIAATSQAQAFWECSQAYQPAFLRQALLEATSQR